MSKIFSVIFISALLILHFFTIAESQTVKITVSGQSATVEGRFETARRNFYFLKEFGGQVGLVDRISDVALTDAVGGTVETKRLQPGEYLATTDFVGFSYKIDLTPPKNRTAAAHVSWIAGDRGLIFLDDVLPQGKNEKTAVAFIVPEKWSVFSGEKPTNGNVYAVSDTGNAVFVIAKAFRTESLDHPEILYMSPDGWQFSSFDAVDLAAAISVGYKEKFGETPVRDGLYINLLKFPGATESNIWEADTRGNTITILSSDTPFKSQSLQRLHEQLRHEIFHLWFPNGVNLKGNYDWFYEGFALYASLKAGVELNQIRFVDYLDTLSRAYAIDAGTRPRISLIEASKQRWAGNNTTVYARGILVAFLCDLAMLESSKGKTDVNDMLREIFIKYRKPAAAANGNEAVIGIMQGHSELVPIIDNYIKGKADIDWSSYLAAAGITANTRDELTTIEKPNSRQRAILDKLGYNNWRKLKP